MDSYGKGEFKGVSLFVLTYRQDSLSENFPGHLFRPVISSHDILGRSSLKGLSIFSCIGRLILSTKLSMYASKSYGGN